METFLFLLELAGTVAFAVSGAVLGIEKHMDIFGVGLLGITTAVGGGILRDLVVGLTPPRAFQDPIYLLVALGVSVVLFFPFVRRIIGRSLFDCLATLPYMLPGTCFGIGYILAFNHAPLKLTGTALIVLANMLFKQLPTSTKICTASLALLPEVQERSARDLGAGRCIRAITPLPR